MRVLPRGVRRIQRGVQPAGRRHHGRGHQDRPCGAAQGSGLSGAHDPDEGGHGLHAVGLHQPCHALECAQVAVHRRGVCRHRLSAQPRRRGARELHAQRYEHCRGAAQAAQPQWHDDPACSVARQRVRQRRQARCAGHCLHEQLRPRAHAALGLARACQQQPRQSGPAEPAGRCPARHSHRWRRQQGRSARGRREIGQCGTDGLAGKERLHGLPWHGAETRRPGLQRHCRQARRPVGLSGKQDQGRRLRRLGINTHAASAQSQRC